MSNWKTYALSLATLGLLTSSCGNDVVKVDENGGNKTDTTSMITDNDSKSSSSNEEKYRMIETSLNSKSESQATGKITFREDGDQVVMKANFSGMNPGKHAIHLHQTANCSSADGKSAGGHWNPTDEQHGKWGDKEGYHKGDIGNFDVDEDGTATVNFETDEWCIGCDDTTKNIVGRAVIVHQGGDDFETQPTGDAGTRVGCAEISGYTEK
ncbi:superoxide dismutase family protein [Brumimicrobium aurantiacum]|uniref:Superoxide dismutase [Cu-Zn] n=1 Tax=Brumimicrobium aurantiacum TaxID=1737063 RepID=A0A3E1F2C4_9FLAO|nr:superoxide dismutase family protein [Brumimicrobium aurantiacum]RFC55972.1 superoxide dismutase family protein [Brumimicrobium aurantiacum]